MRGLVEALRLRGGDVVAFVGAGGKTTAMFACARELRALGWGVVVTTTTRIFVPPPSADLVLVSERDPASARSRTRDIVAGGGIPVVGTATTPDGKLAGIPVDDVAALARVPGVTHVLVEADGSARLPITAPREDEPVIPSNATLVVAIVGIDALDRHVADVAHRPERVSALTGLTADARLDARAIARVLLGPDGNTKGAPHGARIVALVNKADDDEAVARARRVAAALRDVRDVAVIIAALERDGVREVV